MCWENRLGWQDLQQRAAATRLDSKRRRWRQQRRHVLTANGGGGGSSGGGLGAAAAAQAPVTLFQVQPRMQQPARLLESLSRLLQVAPACWECAARPSLVLVVCLAPAACGSARSEGLGRCQHRSQSPSPTACKRAPGRAPRDSHAACGACMPPEMLPACRLGRRLPVAALAGCQLLPCCPAKLRCSHKDMTQRTRRHLLAAQPCPTAAVLRHAQREAALVRPTLGTHWHNCAALN